MHSHDHNIATANTIACNTRQAVCEQASLRQIPRSACMMKAPVYERAAIEVSSTIERHTATTAAEMVRLQAVELQTNLYGTLGQLWRSRRGNG